MIKWKTRYKKLKSPNIPSIQKIKEDNGHKNIIKLNYNESNYGPTPKVLKYSFKILAPHRYPIYHSTELLDKLSSLYNLDIDNFWISNGTDAILDAIPSLFSSIQRGENIIIPSLTYGRISQTCIVHGIEVQKVDLKDGYLNLQEMLRKINKKTSVIYIVNPNMPTGKAYRDNELEVFINKVPKHILIVIDEAYIEFKLGVKSSFEHDKKLITKFDNIIITRTFSKAFALAGYRIGYLISSKNIVELFKRAIQVFPITNTSAAYAIKALSDIPYYENVVNIITKEKEKYYKFFDSHKISYYKSSANFIYVITKNEKWKNADLRLFLLKEYAILIRNVKDIGLRITIGLPNENSLVMKGIKDFLDAKKQQS